MSESSSDDFKPEDWLWLVAGVVGGLLLLCLLIFCLTRMGGSGVMTCGRLCCSCLTLGKNCCGCWCENFFCRADHICNVCGVRNSRQALGEKSDVGKAWLHAYRERKQQKIATKSKRAPLLADGERSDFPKEPQPRSVRSAREKDADDALAAVTLLTNSTEDVEACALIEGAAPNAVLWRGLPLRPIVLVPVPVSGS